jgi:threonyl-tRNA synthetase
LCHGAPDIRERNPMSDLLKITLPDGSLREVAPGTTPADIAAAIGPGLAKALGARVNGELFDITRPFEGDARWRW